MGEKGSKISEISDLDDVLGVLASRRSSLAPLCPEYQMSPDDSYCCAASTASDAPWALLAQLRPTFIHLDGLGLEQTTQLCGRLLGARCGHSCCIPRKRHWGGNAMGNG